MKRANISPFWKAMHHLKHLWCTLKNRPFFHLTVTSKESRYLLIEAHQTEGMILTSKVCYGALPRLILNRVAKKVLKWWKKSDNVRVTPCLYFIYTFRQGVKILPIKLGGERTCGNLPVCRFVRNSIQKCFWHFPPKRDLAGPSHV